MATSVEDRDSRTDVDLLEDGFAAYVESLLEEYHIPGLSIAVVNDGKVSAKVRQSLTVLMAALPVG